MQNSGKFDCDIMTVLRPLSSFYLAEDYHQKYYQKNHAHYSAYKEGSGRQRFIEQVWLKK